MTWKSIKVGDLFTDDEIKAARELYVRSLPGRFADNAAEQIVKPVIHRINKATGQENDPKYFAYVLEYAITKSSADS